MSQVSKSMFFMKMHSYNFIHIILYTNTTAV